jgi:hypothetical protein
MKYLISIIILLNSAPLLANVKFTNCEPKMCNILLSNIDMGIPIYVGNIETENKLNLSSKMVTSIKQVGSKFKVCAGPTTQYNIEFKCFKGTPCVFITNGSVLRSSTHLKTCL